MQNPSRSLRLAPVLSGSLFLLLAACNSQPENVVVGPPDDMKDQLAKAKKVELPPSVTATKTYRCKDNSVVFIDWMNDNKTANIKTKKDGEATHLVAPDAGKPMVADGGYEVSGTASAASAEVTVPGHGKQTCDS
jgi:hypothetical protein